MAGKRMRVVVILLIILMASSILACTAVPNVADEVTITDFEIVGPGFFAGPSPYVLIGLRANERTYPDVNNHLH